MRKFTQRAVLTGLATAVIAALTPAGMAAATDPPPPPDVVIGGCGTSWNWMPGQTTVTGLIYDHSVSLTWAGNPTSATISCELFIDYVTPLPSTLHSYSGFGGQAGADVISFPYDGTGNVMLCERDQYADGYDTSMVCPGDIPQEPPLWVQLFLAKVNAVTAIVNDLFTQYVDPVLCPDFAGLTGDYGPVSVKPDGDVYVTDPLDLYGGGPAYDCPPYGNF